MRFVVISLLTVLIFCSCRTRATDPTRFTEEAYLLEDGRVFQKEWKKQSFEGYDQIYIRPVDTSHLKSLSWWGKQNIANYDDSGVYPTMEGDRNWSTVRNFSKYMNDVFRKEFMNNPENKLKFVNQGQLDRQTLVVEIALTEMVPVKKFLIGLNLIGDGSLKGGVATIEGKIKNGISDKTLMSFTDRKVNSATMVSRESGDLYWYSHAKPIIRNWAKMLVTACNETYPKKEK